LSDLDESQRAALVAAAQSDWTQADLSAADQALCVYAIKLTDTPAAMSETDLENLRSVGFDDVQIHDAIQVVAYFNYINRIADAVHVDLEPEMTPYSD
jgi:uncharacterized peroxidase-related enzyme